MPADFDPVHSLGDGHSNIGRAKAIQHRYHDTLNQEITFKPSFFSLITRVLTEIQIMTNILPALGQTFTHRQIYP